MKQLDFDLVAKRLRFRASSGEMCGDGSMKEQKYVIRCSARAGTATLVLTRDYGNHQFGFVGDPAHDRCLHLSIACKDDVERDAWLRAFFGENVAQLWGQPCATLYGLQRGHWRLFCNQNWQPLHTTNPVALLAAQMYPAIDLGVVVVEPDLAA